MKQILLIPLLFFVCFCGDPTDLEADEITIIPAGGFTTGANINALAGPLFASDIDSVDVFGPGLVTASAAKDGNFATHLHSVELDFSAAPAFFDSIYETPFSRTSLLDHRASAESIVHFTVDTVAEFAVEGFFGVIDDPGTTVPGNVELELELLEFDSFDPMAPPPTTLLYSYQVSSSTLDAGFFAGGLDGDTTNVFDGDLVGTLDPSKFYRWRTLVTTNAIDIAAPTDGGAAGFGSTTLLVFAPSSIPEPAFGLGWVLLVGVCCHRRRG